MTVRVNGKGIVFFLVCFIFHVVYLLLSFLSSSLFSYPPLSSTPPFHFRLLRLTIFLFLEEVNIQTTGFLLLGNWHHVTIVQTGTTGISGMTGMQLYINGTLAQDTRDAVNSPYFLSVRTASFLFPLVPFCLPFPLSFFLPSFFPSSPFLFPVHTSSRPFLFSLLFCLTAHAHHAGMAGPRQKHAS